MKNMVFFLLILLSSSTAFAEIKRTIPNVLRMDFPHELVYMDFDAKDAASLQVVSGMGEERPVQVEIIEKEGKKIARAWFIASMEAVPDEKGKLRTPDKLDVVFKGGAAKAGISLKKDGDFYLIDNGISEFKIRNYGGDMKGVALVELPHWLGGMRVKGSGKWDGKAFFEGSSKVKSAKTEIISQGPVFIDLRISYEFEDDGAVSEKVSAVKLMLGKRSFEYEPDKIPSEDISKKGKSYEMMLRFIAGDPWAEVVERFHLPADKSVANYGIQQYWIYWGETGELPKTACSSVPKDEFQKIDTVMNIPWFEYDTFGGNSSLKILPSVPRPAQKGRPFALLRPRWNQGGGGAQEFFLTSGGDIPFNQGELRKKFEDFRNRNKDALKKMEDVVSKEEKQKEPDKAKIEKLRKEIEPIQNIEVKLAEAIKGFNGLGQPEINKLISEIGNPPGIPQIKEVSDYSKDNPAFGLVAAYPSKWAGPYSSTISAYADKNRNCARFPLCGAYGEEWKDSEPYYGTRCYALCVGPRNLFESTAKMNSLVRRHTDWTLVANINKYILEWTRKDAARAPHILVNSEQLETLREEYKSPKSEDMKEFKKRISGNAEKLAGFEEKSNALDSEKSKLESEIRKAEEKKKSEKDKDRQKEIDGKISELKKAMESADKKLKELKDGGDIKKLSGNEDLMFARLLESGKPSAVPENRMPTPNIYLGTRYQDDSNNPTNYGTRRFVNGMFPAADLFSAGTSFGGANQAAIGYIFTDLDSWPGWHNGWTPGNPNFHTDKYLGSIYAGASMPDHPHAKEWIDFGMSNIMGDLKKVISPDGAGYECPGYSGYSMNLLIDMFRPIFNSGFRNIPAENPSIKKSCVWHRKLITPYDHRIGKRHEAPLGDTHRWDSGMGAGFMHIAMFFKKGDPQFASELAGTFKLLKDSGLKTKEQGFETLISSDSSISPTDSANMDWASDKFEGFGAIFRSNFGTPRESFATLKAGYCMGHYHNDELTYHLYLNNSPVSLDYNCSYHPRGDHAALHNSITFGKEGTVKNNTTGQDVKAMEQNFGAAKMIGFFPSETADIVVAERTSDSLSMSPLYPEDNEFGRSYPERKTSPMTHRRWFALVKHPEKSKISDYIVVFDETKSREPKVLNIHLLSRMIAQAGGLFKATGQYEKEFRLFIASEPNPKCEVRGWGYFDEYMDSPGKEYELKPGESQQDYVKRMNSLGTSLPDKGWEPKWKKKEKKKDENETAEDKHWEELVKATGYQALIPPPNWNSSWMYGEYQQWLRISPAQDKPTLWTLYAFDREKGMEPKFEALPDGKGFKISVNGESEEVTVAPGGQVGQFIVRRDGKENILVETARIPSL